MMDIKGIIEKQYFIVNLMNVDIADMLWADECRDDDDENELDDSEYTQGLLTQEELNLNELENSRAVINYKDKVLSICLYNNKVYRLSLMEFLGCETYKKLTSYFLGRTNIVLKNVSEQVGGIIDTNYGFKFMIEIE